MFKKGPDIDKKKLLTKALDVKKDSLLRLKHFKTLIEHLDFNEIPSLFRTHFSFIYHTFIDTFSTFDCNSKQRRDDLDCIIFMLEKILIYNPELIKKRWQFYSITFVMQKLLHLNNTWRLRQEGVRLFVLWYQILCDETNHELQTMFGSLVPGLFPQQQSTSTASLSQSSLQLSPTTHRPPPALPTSAPPQATNFQHQQHSPMSSEPHALQQQASIGSVNLQPPHNLPIKLCSIDPLVPKGPNEQLPNDETSFYLDSLLQFMVTQITKPFWGSPDEARKNQELSFSFMFSMFKKMYLQHLFPNFNSNINTNLDPISTKSYYSNHSIDRYVDDARNDTCKLRATHSQSNNDSNTSNKFRRDLNLYMDLKQSPPINYHNLPSPSQSNSIMENERAMALSVYQAIVIRWLTRILRQDMIPGQDELIKPGGGNSVERGYTGRELSSGLQDQELSYVSDANSTIIFQNMETTSKEMEVARRVIGTWPENIAVIHELFRRAFLNYYQPASMKRVVNVYKEWICNGGPNQPATSAQVGKNSRLGYTSFGELLQIFVLNSSNAFVSSVNNAAMLDEQVEMCKRIMNIYRYMVMKIYMNTATWEQLLNVMLSITEHLFQVDPPNKKESTIGCRIAPAFFQTFIVSWIRANLYVHISNQMWNEFHRVMKNLVRWRELIEEWSTTMSSLTRVLVKHVYGLSLTDLPLDKPQERRRRPRAMKSFSTAESMTGSANSQPSPTTSKQLLKSATASANSNNLDSPSSQTGNHFKQPKSSIYRTNGMHSNMNRGLTRSNSEGIIVIKNTKLYISSLKQDLSSSDKKIRKIKSEYLLFDTNLDVGIYSGQNFPAHNDVIDSASLKDSHLIFDQDQVIESGHNNNSKSSPDVISSRSSFNKKSEQKSNQTDKCVLLGGTIRGWTPENSVIMWRRMLGLFGNINHIEDPNNHLIAIRCLAVILCDFIKTRENLGISLDNQSTPENPELIPPYTYNVGWLLEATHLPKQFKESRLTAYKLLCLMSIRRHDMELSHQYYTAFYEALHRGLNSSDPIVQESIIKHSTQLLSLELPGCTFLVNDLYEKSKQILLNKPSDTVSSPAPSTPRDQAIQILNTILALYRPIKKLMVLKSEANSPMNLVALGDIRSKIFETFLTCNISRPTILDYQIRSRSLCSMAIHIYQELCDKSDNLDVEKLFDALLTDLQDNILNRLDNNLFRINCDLLRLFADHGNTLAQNRPALVSSVLQIICQLIVRLSTDENNKEPIFCLLICLEDWCMAVGKAYLSKSIEQIFSTVGATDDDDEDGALANSLNDSLITIVLRSLENVINDEQFVDDSSSRTNRGSINTSKGSDTNSQSKLSHSNNSDILKDNRDRIISTNSNSHQGSKSGQQPNLIANPEIKAIKLGCKVLHNKLISYLGQFPFKQIGPSSMSCCVSETDYLLPPAASNESAEFTGDFKNVKNVSLLVIDGSTILSFIGAQIDETSRRPKTPIHIIVRNLCGKYAWDATCIDMELPTNFQSLNQDGSRDSRNSIIVDPDSFQQEDARSSVKYDSDFGNEEGNSGSSLSSRSSHHNRDYIGDLMNQLSSLTLTNQQNSASSTSSSSSQNLYKKRNCAHSVSNSKYKVAQAEETMIALLTNQRFQELNYCEKPDELDRVILKFNQDRVTTKLCENQITRIADIDTNVNSQQQTLTFEQCRQLIQQLGYLSWEKRCKIDSLAKSSRLLRELKNLDNQPNRETHKIAVIYIAAGQEDKNSILANATSSRAFEDFVSGLGWEVNLASHLGFKGGLQSNRSTGETSPYYCNSTTEVIYHVSTRIPIVGPADDESLNKKLRHLGNDEIQIIWSEHNRDYRRGIIPTEFGDVIIAIYPMLTFQGYYRIQISSKPDVPIFGPLFDNCIVHQTSLASLVRATAINASRAKRSKLPYYQLHFEERNRLIDTIIQNHKENVCFEDFAVQLYQTSTPDKRNDQHQTISATCCN